MRRLSTQFLVVVLAVTLSAGAAGAQEGIGDAGAPPPDECTLKARTIEDLERLVASPDAATPEPVEISEPFEMPEGSALVDDELEEVKKDLRRAIACFNTGEPLKGLATYTDRWVREFIGGAGGLTPDVIAALQEVKPLDPEDYVRILQYGAATLLDDGRIAIVVLGDDPADTNPPGERLFILAETEPGRFLIDQVVEIESD
jgi:hypothetical protein